MRTSHPSFTHPFFWGIKTLNRPRSGMEISGSGVSMWWSVPLKILVVPTNFATNEEYDPVRNRWTTRAPMPTARYHLTAAVVNNKIYVIGGYSSNHGDNLNANQEYNPDTNTWVNKKSMLTARIVLASGVINNKIYVIGGCKFISGQFQILTTNEKYNPHLNTWTTKENMIPARSGPAIGVVNNKIYVIGGESARDIQINNNEQYDPSLDRQNRKHGKHTPR